MWANAVTSPLTTVRPTKLFIFFNLNSLEVVTILSTESLAHQRNSTVTSTTTATIHHSSESLCDKTKKILPQASLVPRRVLELLTRPASSGAVWFSLSKLIFMIIKIQISYRVELTVLPHKNYQPFKSIVKYLFKRSWWYYLILKSSISKTRNFLPSRTKKLMLKLTLCPTSIETASICATK